ncbi:MAG: hypothetical protein EOP84_23130, partial [Verrucomicrobiaceae bacterium]
MLFACPHCQMSLQSEPSMAGQTVSCPGCGNRLQIPADRPAVSGSAPAGAHRKRGGWPETDPSNVSAWRSLGLGLAAMLVTVGLLYTIRKTFVGEVFFSGGWVNYAEFLLFFWGLGILFLKNQKTKHQRDAMLLDVLPKRIGDQVNPANVGIFIDSLYRLPERLRDSMMVNRIRKGLELFETRTNNSEVAALMEAQSNIDANRIAGSYALLKVFLWAIPILGFIGTVLGLSFAMAGFGSTDLTDMTAMKGAVGAITSGLATAFNTTLLGLILSMLLIFPMSTMQKREEDCLNDIDAFCNENVLPRLNDGGVNGAQINELVTNPAAFAQMLSDFVTAQQQLVDDLRTVSGAVQEAVGQLENRAQVHQQRVE